MAKKLEFYLLISIFLAVIYCEFLADYVKLFSCSWPNLPEENAENAVKAMILADTHILGPIRGHWLDKLYREWHMKRAFQAAVTLFRPEVIFILGDLFDEGYIINHEQFKEHVLRFQRYFYTDPKIAVISAVGNHDVGFHYRLHPFLTERFEENFNNTGVHMYSMKDVHFVVINSMAMENDNCYFCENAIQQLQTISDQLNCLRSPACDNKELLKKHGSYSSPIVMQHFPTFRPSDKVCLKHDAPNIETFRENWEVLSKDSTDMLGRLLKPRLAFAGHSHHFCLSINRWKVEEYTVASFNWRNKIDPSFLLAQFSPTKYAVNKCDMLHQNVVYNIYLATTAIAFIFLIHLVFSMCSKKLRRHRKTISYKAQ